ncbi:unnamed protein product [Blepharisma stoltei]|uniref:Uncharacterized protein n=1 Tax=Blepharisma stoltei TaxID=1481888 RepID=A0AAU9IFK1_9CILI|nr:unnamed protein product [Blepharisma stoltei]
MNGERYERDRFQSRRVEMQSRNEPNHVYQHSLTERYRNVEDVYNSPDRECEFSPSLNYSFSEERSNRYEDNTYPIPVQLNTKFMTPEREHKEFDIKDEWDELEERIKRLKEKVTTPIRPKETPRTPETSQTTSSSLKKSESLKANNLYSKYNTLSPYAKSTFSHDVRTMENKKYTYKQVQSPKPSSRKSSLSRESQYLENFPLEEKYIKGLIEIVKRHCKGCYSFKQEIIRYNRSYMSNNED